MMHVDESRRMDLQVTIVFKKTWDALHKLCDTCNGLGIVAGVSCSWCGDGTTIGSPGSGHYWRYIVHEGSSRSSKTVSLIDCYDLYAREKANMRLTVWRDTKTDCKKTVLNDALKHLKRTGRYKLAQDFNKTESIFTYSTDSTFEIHGTDDEETVHGLTQDIAWFNEPYKISDDTVNQIDQRTSYFVIFDWNPKKKHLIDDIKKNPRTIVIYSTFKDNPFCPAEQRNKILSYQPVKRCKAVELRLFSKINKNPVENEAILASEYDLQANPLPLDKKLLNEIIRCRDNESNRTANDFNWLVYGLGVKGERPNRIFHWNPISIEEYRKINTRIFGIGQDWGTVDPWAILEAKYLDGKLYLHELNYESENQIRKRLTPTELSQINAIDAGKSDTIGIVTWRFAHLGVSKKTPVVSDPNRLLKVAALHGAGYWSMKAAKPPGSILDGIDLLLGLEVYYTSDSKNLEYEQENYSREVDNYGVVQEEPEDVDNHLMDAARYITQWFQLKGYIRT